MFKRMSKKEYRDADRKLMRGIKEFQNMCDIADSMRKIFRGMWVIMYGNDYYTQKPPIWGITFSPKLSDAKLFQTEGMAKQFADEKLQSFDAKVVQI